MPLESDRRKPTFSEQDSTWIEMADGQPWALRRPHLRLRPRFENGRATASRMVPYLDGGSELGALLDAMEADGDFVSAAINIGAYLLSFNYDLSDDDLESLFSFESGSADDPLAWVRRIVQVANGVDVPKAPTSDGGAAPS